MFPLLIKGSYTHIYLDLNRYRNTSTGLHVLQLYCPTALMSKVSKVKLLLAHCKTVLRERKSNNTGSEKQKLEDILYFLTQEQ